MLFEKKAEKWLGKMKKLLVIFINQWPKMPLYEKKIPIISKKFLKEYETQFQKKNIFKKYIFLPNSHEMHMFIIKYMHICFIYTTLKNKCTCFCLIFFFKWIFFFFLNFVRDCLKFSEISEEIDFKFLHRILLVLTFPIPYEANFEK